ncbi:nucleotidyl transferase AbiEii/AbiGii toxin family protein [Streptomyces thermocoprophilus]|uniref:Nucleotidyl transferase AbiEii/AbiGii toxin family protein n=1 Tax=Streptomyces thermocoprophilus TaxID=78356 RepID=A0ABV5VKN9_9ACTN
MPELHTRLLADVIALGSPYPLVLTGGYTVRARRLVNRPSQDLDVATENPAPMADIAATLRAGLEARGWKVHALETAPLSARFTVTDPATRQDCEGNILKEIFWRPVAQSPYGPALAEEDVIGTKVRALADRGAPHDLIDVFAASRHWSNAELEEFGRRHARARFEREDLQSGLTGAEGRRSIVSLFQQRRVAEIAPLGQELTGPGSGVLAISRCSLASLRS